MKRVVAIACAACASGCQGAQSMFVPANHKADQLAGLGWWSFLGFTIVGVAMWALLLYAAMRRRGTFAEHAPPDLDDGKRWIYVGGLAIPGVVFLGFLVAALVIMQTANPGGHTHHGGHADLKITGHQWWWEVDYLAPTPSEQITSANELHIPVGHPVTIQLASADVIHSFWIPNLQGKVDLIPGFPNQITISAREPGTYLGQCAEYCGSQHARMRLTVIADAPADYAAWRQREARDATIPMTSQQRRGREVFETGPCALCHTIRGTQARGRIGPDLTHLASRHGLAASSFPLQPAYLAAWALHAQSLKPGVQMPDLTMLTGSDLNALLAYLGSLH
jgi:cytochrome c oxidase subunit 2